MKKLISIVLLCFVFQNVTVFAISGKEVSDFRQSQSEKCSKELQGIKVKDSDELILNYIDEQTILPGYSIWTAYEDTLKFSDKFNESELFYFAKTKNSDKVYLIDQIDGSIDESVSEYGVLFDDEAIADKLTQEGVENITDMRLFHKYGGNHLYLNTDKGEYIIIGKEVKWNKMPGITLKTGIAYSADEFIAYDKAYKEKSDEVYADKPRDVMIGTDENGEEYEIVITPTPKATPTTKTTPTPKVTPMPETTPTVKPQETAEPDVTATPVPDKLTVKGGDVITVKVNNKPVTFPDALPFVDGNDRTQVPVRAVSELLNCKVDWQQDIKTAVITKENGDVVKITLDSDIMTLNEREIKMDTTAILKDDRTFIPVRFVAEALGLTVDWEE